MEIDYFFIFLTIALLFFVLLIAKALIRLKFKKFDFCVICASVSLTWLALLALYYIGFFNNPVLIALLMGGSIVGIFYLIEGKVKKELKLFRLPFLLSLIFAAYLLLSLSISIKTIFLLIALWLLFLFVFYYRKSKKLKKAIDKIIECCKRW